MVETKQNWATRLMHCILQCNQDVHETQNEGKGPQPSNIMHQFHVNDHVKENTSPCKYKEDNVHQIEKSSYKKTLSSWSPCKQIRVRVEKGQCEQVYHAGNTKKDGYLCSLKIEGQPCGPLLFSSPCTRTTYENTKHEMQTT